jgi:hypothetical protein
LETVWKPKFQPSLKNKVPEIIGTFKLVEAAGIESFLHSRLDSTFSNSVRNPLEKDIKKGLEAFSKSPNPLK